MIRQRVRVRFLKQGDLRLISHRDLLRTMQRLFRRAGLPLGMTEGFHPKPRMSFPSALALGVDGRDEVMEFELAQRISAESLLELLRAQAPKGLVFASVELREPGAGKAQAQSMAYEIVVPPSRRDAAAARIGRLDASPSHLVRRAGRKDPLDLRDSLIGLELDGDVLRMRLQVTRTASARPRDVLEALDLADLLDEGRILVRSQVQLADEIGSTAMPNKKDTEHEGRDVDQCCSAGRKPDCDH